MTNCSPGSFLFAATVAILIALPFFIMADDAKSDDEGKDETPIVEDITPKGLRLSIRSGRFGEPVKIATSVDLAKALGSEDAAAKLKEKVDFEKQTLLLFQWSGSGQDKLEFAVTKKDDDPQVEFTYRPGRTRDLRGHLRLFAVKKGVEWKMSSGR